MVATGLLPMLVELQAQVPASVLALLRIPGVGPKKAAALHKELGIKTLEELKAACQEQRVRGIKGFGEKTEAAILAGLSFAASTEVTRMYWAEADVYAQSLLDHMPRYGISRKWNWRAVTVAVVRRLATWICWLKVIASSR